MYDIPEDCLLTYDPEYLDFHSDSTDFEDSQIQKVTTTKGNHSLISKTNKKYDKYFIPKKSVQKRKISSISVSNSSKEIWESETIYNQNEKKLKEPQGYINEKCRIELDNGDGNVKTVKSKRSLMRYKVIPCISGMFKRSSNYRKKMSTVKDDDKDDACQTFRVNYEPRMRQLDRQCYVTQPIYDSARKLQTNPQTKNCHQQLLARKLQRCEYSNAQYSLTSSSEAGRTETQIQKDKGWKWKKQSENNIIKSFVDQTEKKNCIHYNQLRNYILKQRQKMPYQVYRNSEQYTNQTGNDPKGSTDTCSTASAAPSTCSGFWEYLFNKINNKYQPPNLDNLKAFKECYCRHSNSKIGTRSFKQCSPKTCAIHPCCVYPCGIEGYPPDACSVEHCISRNPSPNQIISDKNSDCCKMRQSSPCPCKKRSANMAGSLPRKQAASQKPIDSSIPRYSPKVPCSPKVQCCSPKPTCSPAPVSPKLASSPRRGSPIKPKHLSPLKPPTSKEKRSKEKVDCQCPPDLELEIQTEDFKPCQIPHDCMTDSVSKKYNGEILCIHNPPCVLINGCLNLPYPKPEPAVATMWPVVECHRASFQHLFRKKRQKKYVEQSSQYQPAEQACQYQAIVQNQSRVIEQSCQYQVIDQSCQYQVPSNENYDITDQSCQYYPETMNAYQVTDHQKEKMIQSSCNHKPPCEVKRTCLRPKYDPKLQTSCIHVPMCDNFPMCVLDSINMENGQAKKTCRHKPKCAEVPICRRNYYVEWPKPARDEAGTQVRPRSKMICRHEPPCLMIPRCLNLLCAETCCQYGAVPDCVHQPMCEMIPACCRKSTKEMVSVRSQHPNSCRIV